METLVQDEIQSPVKNQPAAHGADRAASEVDQLLSIKRERRIGATQVPCPSCGVVVEMTINRCPFCESDIAAETALARETTRRLRELSGQLDHEHASRTREVPKPRGFFARLKCVFAGDPAPEPLNTFKADPTAKRLLGQLAPGDAIRVIGEDGPWLQVKTPTSEIGWVYSSLKKR